MFSSLIRKSNLLISKYHGNTNTFLLRSFSTELKLNHEVIQNISAIKERLQDTRHTLFEVNLSHPIDQYRRWVNLLPRIKPFYAVKCQPDPRIIQALAMAGCGFDCASKDEIDMALKSLWSVYDEGYEDEELRKKIAAENIVFANPFKFQADMLFAKSNGVSMTTFDSEGEVHRIKKHWPDSQLIIRVNTPKKFDAKCQLGDKFGAHEKDVKYLLDLAKSLDLPVIGCSFHVGNMCSEFEAWPDTIEYCSEVFETIREFDYNPYLLDIGGGYPGLSSILTHEEVELQRTFDETAARINTAVDKYFPESGNYKIIAEPGTYFVHGAYTLATEVIGKREIHPEDYNREFPKISTHNHSNSVVKKGSFETFRFKQTNDLEYVKVNDDPIEDDVRYIYILDDGVYGSFNILQFMQYSFPLMVILNEDLEMKNLDNKEPNHVCKIYGPTCDLLDCIVEDGELQKLHVGDWLIWLDFGAYTNATRSDFNGITQPISHYSIKSEDEIFLQNRKKELLGSCNDEKQNQVKQPN